MQGGNNAQNSYPTVKEWARREQGRASGAMDANAMQTGFAPMGADPTQQVGPQGRSLLQTISGILAKPVPEETLLQVLKLLTAQPSR